MVTSLIIQMVKHLHTVGLVGTDSGTNPLVFQSALQACASSDKSGLYITSFLYSEITSLVKKYHAAIECSAMVLKKIIQHLNIHLCFN